VVKLWKSEEEDLLLALDATTLRQTLTVLSVSVLVGRCAIPVAWTILPATKPGKWKPHWRGLLRCLAGNIGDYHVWVTADRGLYAKWLFTDIVACGGHPLLRVNPQGSCLVWATQERWTLAAVAQRVRGGWWHGRAVCFAGKARLDCTLLALWDEGQRDAWLLLTDCPSETVSPTWYALRMWIEAGFKALKSSAFHWERTRMTDPARAERLWLVLALATLGSLSLADLQLPEVALVSRLSFVKQGIFVRLAACIQHWRLPVPALRMQPLPPAPVLQFVDLLKTYP
jgi:Transposase DDE domain